MSIATGRDSYRQMLDRHIEETEALLERQQRYLAWLLERGRDISGAQEFLDVLGEALAQLRARREWINNHPGVD